MDMTPPAWRKSSYSGSSGDNCIETASQLGTVAVRDTKDPSGPQLTFAAGNWDRFLSRVRQARA